MSPKVVSNRHDDNSIKDERFVSRRRVVRAGDQNLRLFPAGGVLPSPAFYAVVLGRTLTPRKSDT